MILRGRSHISPSEGMCVRAWRQRSGYYQTRDNLLPGKEFQIKGEEFLPRKKYGRLFSYKMCTLCGHASASTLTSRRALRISPRGRCFADWVSITRTQIQMVLDSFSIWICDLVMEIQAAKDWPRCETRNARNLARVDADSWPHEVHISQFGDPSLIEISPIFVPWQKFLPFDFKFLPREPSVSRLIIITALTSCTHTHPFTRFPPNTSKTPWQFTQHF